MEEDTPPTGGGLVAACEGSNQELEAQENHVVDEMRIHSMYKMVEDVNVRSHTGMAVHKKVLYLTNKQLALFDKDAMERCIQALDLGEFKFVIQLVTSTGPHDPMGDDDDRSVVQEQVILFMGTVILPVAKETRAVILLEGAAGCALASALAGVALSEQARLGKDCPFHVIATVEESQVHGRISQPATKDNLAAQLANGCQAWKRRLSVTRERNDADGQVTLEQCASHYIVFECLDEGTGEYDWQPCHTFKSLLLACLTKHVPSIAIQSHGLAEGLPFISGLVSRSIPLLVIDSFERAITTTQCSRPPKTWLAAKSEAFPRVTREQALKLHAALKDPHDTAGRMELLHIASNMLERHQACIPKDREDFITAGLAFLHAVLHVGAGRAGESKTFRPVPLHERITEMEKAKKYSKQFAEKAALPDELVSEAIKLLKPRVTSSDDWFAAFNILTSPSTFSGSFFDVGELRRILWSVARIDRLPSSNSLEALRIIQDAWDHTEVYHLVASRYKFVTKASFYLSIAFGFAITLLSVLRALGIVSEYMPVVAIGVAQTILSAYSSFINPAVRWQQLRIAALSIESHIWMFRTRAGAYRVAGGAEYQRDPDEYLAKVVRDIKSEVLDGADIKSTSFYSRSTLNQHRQHDPNSKGFSQQRSFDTEQGSNGHAVGKAAPSEHLKLSSVAPETGVACKDDEEDLARVLSAASEGGGEAQLPEDSGYSPLQPNDYIRFRAQRALAFYRRRIPHVSRARHVGHWMLMVSSSTSVLLAFLGQASWTAVVSAFGFAVVAYLEFEGIAGKVSRYSSTVAALQDVILWWHTLPQIDRSVTANIDRLVLSCEDILQGEQQAWKSTSRAVRMLQKHVHNDEDPVKRE